MRKFILASLLTPLFVSVSYAGIVINPSITTSDIVIDTVEVDGVEYHMISVEGFETYPDVDAIGTPCLPFRSHCFLLPPQIQIDELEIISTTWDTLPGKYYIYPTQNTSMEDSTFELPDSLIYSSSDP